MALLTILVEKDLMTEGTEKAFIKGTMTGMTCSTIHLFHCRSDRYRAGPAFWFVTFFAQLIRRGDQKTINRRCMRIVTG
jgi:hypothetical protein